MINEARVIPEGVSPRFVTLPVLVSGVDDSALRDLSSQGEVTYLERQFYPLSDQEQSAEPLIGIWLIYAEVRVQQHIQAINRRLRESVSEPERSTLSGEERERYERLKKWRAHVSKALQLPAYCLFHNAQLEAIARRAPTSLQQLGQIKGVGQQKLRKYGDSVLAVLKTSSDPLTWPQPQEESSGE